MYSYEQAGSNIFHNSLRWLSTQKQQVKTEILVINAAYTPLCSEVNSKENTKYMKQIYSFLKVSQYLFNFF